LDFTLPEIETRVRDQLQRVQRVSWISSGRALMINLGLNENYYTPGSY
jgi:hypothetical protein